MNARYVIGGFAAAALLITACGPDGKSPLAPSAPSFSVVIPPNTPEVFKLCKDGSSADFSYQVTDRVTGVVTNGTVTLADGECRNLVVKGGLGAFVTVTETAAQSGYQFSHVDVTKSRGNPASTFISRTETDPTVFDTIGGGLANFAGVVAVYYNEHVPAGVIGDFVWRDLNGDGVQDAGEPGIPGVTVTLGGDASASTTTDANGNYSFTGLAAGDYTVTVGTITGCTTSPSGQGGDPNKDSNASPAAVTLASNTSTDNSIDFGCVPPPPPPPPTGRIGDFVWSDLNGNGVQDFGEPGIPGVTVTLGGDASASTTTDANGNYFFNLLSAGDYTVTVSLTGCTASPSGQGGDPDKDSNGSPASVTLANNGSVDFSVDFGCVPPPSGQIGDFVWIDDGDGIQEIGETGFAGLTVTLNGPVSGSTTTDASGHYLFTGLPAGSYTVSVATPVNYTAAPSLIGGDPLKDSNGSPASVTLATNSSVDVSIDFGFVLVPVNALGRMTGGGAQIDADGVRITRGFTLHCDIALSNNLEINWPGSGGGRTAENNFHITRPLTSAQCILDPNYNQPPPAAPFNTFIGVAHGTLNGVEGARVEFVFIDAGEPGRNDLASFKIYAPNGTLVYTLPLTNLDHGNIQAHYDQPHGSKAPK